MPEIKDADFFDDNNCNILSQLMPDVAKSFMQDFINGDLLQNPVQQAMGAINGMMGENMGILGELGGTIEGLDSLASTLSGFSTELQNFTDHTNRLSGISVDSVKANFMTTFNVMKGFNAMANTFKNAGDLLEDNFTKAFSSLDPNITGGFMKDISGNLRKINTVLKEIQRQCGIAGGAAGDACAKLVGSLSSITESLASSISNIKGIMDQDNAIFAVALAALERYALGNTLISSALMDPCFSGALAKNLILNPEGATSLDAVAKKFGKDIPGSRPLLSDFIGGGDAKEVSPLESAKGVPPGIAAPPTITGTQGTVAQGVPPLLAPPPADLVSLPKDDEFVSYPGAFPKATDPPPPPPPTPPQAAATKAAEAPKVGSSESKPDNTKITGKEPEIPCGAHIYGQGRLSLLSYTARIFEGQIIQTDSMHFQDDARAILFDFFLELTDPEVFNFTTKKKEKTVQGRYFSASGKSISRDYSDELAIIGGEVILNRKSVKKKKTPSESWVLGQEILTLLIEGDTKSGSGGLKSLYQKVSKNRCEAIGRSTGAITDFENTAFMFNKVADSISTMMAKDIL